MSSWGIVVQTGSWIRAGKHDRPTRLLLDDKQLALLQVLAPVSVLGVLVSSWGILIVVQTGSWIRAGKHDTRLLPDGK